MLPAVAIAQVAAAVVVATCSVPNDPQQREWRLERRDGAWHVVFRGRMLDKPTVALRLPGAAPVVAGGEVRLSYATANGGRTIEWRATNGASTLDLHVSHGLEVNVEADLDPAVDHINTEGILPVTCILRSGDLVISRSGDSPATEWVIAAGAARSVKLFESTANHRYAVLIASVGRELTRPLGPGFLRGRFVWAAEAMPVFAQTAPSHVYGFGLAPVVWRWNFEPRPRWSAFGELAMGGVWTSAPIPEKTSRANFTAHWGGGVRLRRPGGTRWTLGYRFQHISNGNNLGSNPGVNSHVLLLGFARRRH